MEKQMHTVSISLKKFEAKEQEKHELIMLVIQKQISPLAQFYGTALAIGIEDATEENGIYQTYGTWARGILNTQENSAELIISGKAIKELSDSALIGLLHHEASELFMARFAAEKFPIYIIDDKNGNLPYPAKEAMVDTMAYKFFNSPLVDFRTETANIGYREGGLSAQFYRDYFAELEKFAPAMIKQEVIDKIKQGLDFKDEL